MISALQDTKIWISRKAILTHSNKPVQLRIHIMNNSISHAFFVIEELPNSFCFIPLVPEIGVFFSVESTYQIIIRFIKYENISLTFKFSNYRDLEIFVSYLCKSAILFSNHSNETDLFYQQNLIFLRRIKSPDNIKFPPQIPNAGSCTTLTPITLDSEAQKIWEEGIYEKNTQFYIKGIPLRISFLTWNVASGEPDKSVLPYLRQAFQVPVSEVDMILIALQEIDMSMKSVVTGNTRASSDWRNLISQVVTKEDFNVVATDSIGGVFCIALVKSSFSTFVTSVSVTSKKLGASGMLANKAALYFKFNLGHQTSVCAISCHLAPHDQNWEQRNTQWHEILADLEPTDYVIFMGDLNYRITLDYDTVISNVKEKKISELVNKDQLTITRKSDSLIGKFNEAPIRFNPTFKFDKHSDVYDTSPKRRIPSWTDRVLIRTAEPRTSVGLEDVLYFESDIIHHYMANTELFDTDCFRLFQNKPHNFPSQPECICYRNLKSSFSDHRPVNGVFRFVIPEIDEERKKLLKEIIDAKFDEMKRVNKPAIDATRSEDGKLTLSNRSLVWAQWQVTAKPENVEISPNKGILMVEEKICLDLNCSDGNMDGGIIKIGVEFGDELIIELPGKA